MEMHDTSHYTYMVRIPAPLNSFFVERIHALNFLDVQDFFLHTVRTVTGSAARKKSNSKYRRMYGLSCTEITKMFNINYAKVQELHEFGTLGGFIESQMAKRQDIRQAEIESTVDKSE